MRINVDGETFDVTARPDHSGTYDFTWLSGRDPSYGFSIQMSRSDRTAGSAQLEQYARQFLNNLNPEIRHID